jgi:hypothetical protein
VCASRTRFTVRTSTPSIMNKTATYPTCMHAYMHEHGSPICFLGICLRMRMQRAHVYMCGIGIPALQPAAGKLTYQAQCRALWAVKFQYHLPFGSFAPHRRRLHGSWSGTPSNPQICATAAKHCLMSPLCAGICLRHRDATGLVLLEVIWRRVPRLY